MKKYLFLNVLSFIVVAIFFLIAVGYLGTETETKSEYLGNGIYKTTYTQRDHNINGNPNPDISDIMIGPRDEFGKWHGEVTQERIILDNQKSLGVEKYTFFHGLKHGKCWIRSYNGELYNICYNMGKVVPCDGNIVSNIADYRSGFTAVEILKNKYPGFLIEKLPENQGVRDSVELFITAIEKKLNTYTLNNDNFDTYFEEVDGSIDSFSGYSNWYQLSGRFASGENEAKDFEFRRAVIERYTTTKRPIADIIQNRYPLFRNQIESEFNISTADFDAFCNEFDNKMDLKINIPVNDPFFIDSLDNWMGQLFSEYFDEDHNFTFSKLKLLFSHSIKSGNRYDVSPQSLVSEYLHKNRTDTVPVYEAILNLLLTGMIEVDVIKLSIKEACLTNQNVPLPPEIVTNILGQNTEGIRVRGLITFDGNAAITRSGIVWDTVYNPELTSNNYINPDSKLDFNVFIDNLIPGKRYFVRSYAVNKVGIVYGNTLEFIAGEVSSNKDFLKEGLSWKVYPNPANNQFNIAFEEPLAKVEVIIYTLNGRDVFHKSYNNIEDIKVNSADWPAGTYSIVLKGPNFKQSKRIILQR